MFSFWVCMFQLKFVKDPRFVGEDKLRCVMLYALRYERTSRNEMAQLTAVLRTQALSPEDKNRVDV